MTKNSDREIPQGNLVIESDSWRKSPSQKAKDIARETEMLARRAKAAGLEVTAYILELAANEAHKDADRIDTKGVHK